MAEKFLLDTCLIIWVARPNGRISAKARDVLLHPTSQIFVASISVAEIARLYEKNRIVLRDHWKPWLRNVIGSNGWVVLPATWEIMEEAYSLPPELHGDPADRILVATARLHGLALVTPDKKLLDYPHVETIW